MNTKIIVAVIATIIATISGQYYYPSPYAYAGYYPYAAAPYAAYAPVAAATPVVAAPAVVPSAFAPVAYAWGSNKGKNDTEGGKVQENVKLTN